LEREYRNDELLYEVYLAKKDYIGAQKVADKLYKLTKKPSMVSCNLQWHSYAGLCKHKQQHENMFSITL